MNLTKYMARLKGHGKTIRIVLGTIVVSSLTTAAVVQAAIPDTSGKINACYVNLTRAVTLTDPAGSCGVGQTAISWDQNKGPGTFLSNLVNADFTLASLPYRNFAGTDMHGSTLTNANMTGSNFSDANLSGTTVEAALLRNATLTGTNFSNATIGNGTDFNNVTLTNTNFSGVTFDGGNSVVGGDFQTATLSNITIYGAFLYGNMHGVNFTSTTFDQSAKFDGVDLTNADFHGLSPAAFRAVSSDISNANFSSTTFTSGSVFTYDTAASTNFTNAHFTDTDFTGTNLSTATLSGVTWSNVTCPDGTNSNSHSNTCAGHLAP